MLQEQKSQLVAAGLLAARSLKDENGSDSHGIEFGYHFLSHFKSNTDLDILGYECKTDASDSDSNSDIDLIYELTFNYFIY